jgi:membrane protein DedA with SNARE-associated domain
VLTARIVPVIRSLISLPAGMSRMDMRRFLLFTALGTSLWNAFLCGLGFVLGNNWAQMLAFFDQYEYFVLGLSAALVFAFIAWKVRQRRLRAAKSAATS